MLTIVVHRRGLTERLLVGDAGEFKESEHPREKGGEKAGQFTTGGGGSEARTPNPVSSKSASEMTYQEYKKAHEATRESMAEMMAPEFADLGMEQAHSVVQQHPHLEKLLGVQGVAVVAAYAGDGFRDLNAGLRGDPSEKNKKFARALSSTLGKLPKHEGDVYRGAVLSSDQIAKYKVGATINERGFTSTSTNVQNAYSSQEQGSKAQDNVQFKIKSRTGVSIDDFGQMDESEVLFRAGTKFRVTSNNGSVIEMEEV